MEGLSNLSLLSAGHVTHSLEWMVTHASNHRLFCLLCVCDLLEDTASVPVMKQKFILNEMSSILKDSSEVVTEIFTNHETFTWHLVDMLFEIVQQNSEHLCQISIEVLLQVCCQLQSDDLVYGLLQKILTKILRSSEPGECLSVLSLMNRLLDSIPSLTETLLESEGGLMDFAVQALSSTDGPVVCSVLSLLNSLFKSSTTGTMPTNCIEEICRRLFAVITSTQHHNVIESAVGLLKTFSEVPEYVGVIMPAAFSVSQHTLPAVVKKILHTRKANLQISAVHIIGQTLSNSQNLTELAEKLLDADLAEFLFEQLSTTNKILLSSIFCSLLLLTESETFFSKCHSVLGIDSILRSAEQCLAVSYFDSLHYGLQLLCVVLEKHPTDQKLMSGVDMFKHASALLTHCMQIADSKVLILGMKCLRHLFRKDYLPAPVNFSDLQLPITAVVKVLNQFPRPLVRGTKRHLATQRADESQQPNNAKVAKQEEAILNAVQLLESVFSLSTVSSEDLVLYDESQFTAPSREGSIGDSNHGNSLSSFIQHLLGVFDREIIPLIMINYEIFREVASTLFGSFLRTLCHCLDVDVTLDLSEKLVSSSFIHWAMEIKCKYYSDCMLRSAVDGFVSSLCMRLIFPSSSSSSSSSDVLSLALKAALRRSRDIKSFGELLTVDLEEMNNHEVNDQSEATILEVQEGCLAVLYCAWLHDDKLLTDVVLMEKLSCLLLQRAEDNLSDNSLKHITFLLASVYHSGDTNQQIHGISTLCRMVKDIPARAIYTHHKQVIKWCFSCSGMSSKFALQMLELWIQRLVLPDEEIVNENNEDMNFLIPFLVTNQQCLSALLNLFITSVSPEIVEKVLRVLQILFTDPMTGGSDLSAVTKRVIDELPDLQRQVLMTEEKNERKVHCQCGQVLAVRPSDLKLIFHVMKLMSLSVVEGESRLSAEEMLTTMNYISSVLLQALNSQDSRATSMMISSEPLLNLLHRTITESQSKSLDVIFSASKKLRYQSLCVVALLVKSCADFKLKPGHIMKFEVEFILGSLMDKDVCVKDLEFESQIVVLLPQHSQPRQGEDAGLELSAATIRSLFFLLQNIILQGSDFLSWTCVQCLSSLLRYIRHRSKQLSDHLAQQPWNEFLINSCVDFYGDTCPSSWLFMLIPLFPTLVSHKKIESLITMAMKQDTATVDHRMLASLLFLLHRKWDKLNSNKKFVDTTKQWLEGLSATITTVASTEITPVEMLPLNEMVIPADLTRQDKSLQSMLGELMNMMVS